MLNFGHFEWDHLSIDDHFSFFPAAPTREPLHSLLQQAPDQGRRLVRDVANQAIRSWRQLHRLSHEKDGTPIPLVMQFPWCAQVFWCDSHLYLGARGSFGPSTLNSGWMATALALFEVQYGLEGDAEFNRRAWLLFMPIGNLVAVGPVAALLFWLGYRAVGTRSDAI